MSSQFNVYCSWVRVSTKLYLSLHNSSIAIFNHKKGGVLRLVESVGGGQNGSRVGMVIFYLQMWSFTNQNTF